MTAKQGIGEVVVAVGPTRAEAARVFGPAYDHLLLTTFDDYAAERPPGAPTVCVTASDGLESFLSANLSATIPGRVLLALPESADLAALVDVLDGMPGLRYDGAYAGQQPCLVIASAAKLESARAAVDRITRMRRSRPSRPAVSLSAPKGLYDRPSPPDDPSQQREIEPEPDPLPDPESDVTNAPKADPTPTTEPDSVPRQPARRGLATTVARALGATTRRGALVTLLVVGLVLALLVVAGPVTVGVAGGSGFSWALAGVLAAVTLTQLATVGFLLIVATRLRRAMVTADRTEQRSVRHGQRLSKLDASLKDVAETAKSNTASTKRALAQTGAQTEAVVNLFTTLDVNAPVPPLDGWAAAPDVVLLLVRTLIDERPRAVVECGSGASTLFLSLAAAKFSPETRVVALEHDEAHAERTNRLLELHGVSHIGEARHAKLVDTGLDDHEAPWYDESVLGDLDEIGLVFVDGPPTTTGEFARYPALPKLRDRFAHRVSIVLDDMVRDEERSVAARWAKVLPDFDSQKFPLRKGAMVLRRG